MSDRARQPNINHKIIVLSLSILLLFIFSLAGCATEKGSANSAPESTGSVVASPASTIISSIPSPVKWASQRPQFALPDGVELKFETVETDRLPLPSRGSSDYLLYPITNQPSFSDYNNRVLYDLFPQTQSKLTDIDYTQYFVLIAFQGYREYNKSGIRIEHVTQDGNMVYVIAGVEEDTTVAHSLVTTPYHIIKIDKAQMPQLGVLNFRLLDQNGFELGKGGANIPDDRPVPSPTRIPAPGSLSDVQRLQINCKLELPQPPKVGDTAELTFTLNDIVGITGSQAWLEFYWRNTVGSYLEASRFVQVDPKDIVVSGEAAWKIDSPENKTVQLKDTIRFPREGVWEIRGFFYNHDKQTLSSSLWLAVKKDAAADANQVYRFKDFADIKNLMSGDKGYGSTLYVKDPILMDLDISKAPKAGESVKLTCKIVSLRQDLPNVIVHIALWKRVLEQPNELETVIKYVTMPENYYYLSGTLLWQGSLKQNQVVEISSTIKIPESGEWEIYAGGDTLAVDARYGNFGRSQQSDAITLSVTNETGWFGYPVIEPAVSVNAMTGKMPSWRFVVEGTTTYSAASSSITLPPRPQPTHSQLPVPSFVPGPPPPPPLTGH